MLDEETSEPAASGQEGGGSASVANRAPEQTAVQPDAVLVRLRRVGDPDQPIVCITAEYKGEFHPWHSDPKQTTFDVPAYIAAKAIESGGFEVAPESRTKLKR